MLERVDFGVHHTDELKPEDTPDNLFEPIEGHDTSQGPSATGRIRGAYNRLELRPAVKRAVLVGAALGTLTILRAR